MSKIASKKIKYLKKLFTYIIENNEIENKDIMITILLNKDVIDNAYKTESKSNEDETEKNIKRFVDLLNNFIKKMYIEPKICQYKSKNKIWNKILNDYNYITLREVDSFNCEIEEETIENNSTFSHALYANKSVYFKNKTIKNPNNDDLFALLHEIGHIETYEPYIYKVESEYLATQWALDHCDKYGIIVDKKLLEWHQNYIYSYLKNKRYKNKYKLKYSK